MFDSFATPWTAARQAALSLTNSWNLLNLMSIAEKAVTPHPSTLAWKIPWMEEPGVLRSTGSHRVGHDWSDLQQQQPVHWASDAIPPPHPLSSPSPPALNLSQHRGLFKFYLMLTKHVDIQWVYKDNLDDKIICWKGEWEFEGKQQLNIWCRTNVFVFYCFKT